MATVQDVARRAGVATSTVSRYLNGRLRLTAETEERIREAIAALDYVPHAVARHLATGRSRVIGLVVPGVSNPFFAVIAEEVEALVAAQGYSLLLCNTKGLSDREVAYVSLLHRNRLVDGLIYVGMQPRNAQLGDAICSGLPVVVLDERLAGLPPVSTVVVDNHAGGFAATHHLITLGHRRIGFVCGLAELATARERYAGYLAALEVAGLPIDASLVHFDAYTEEAAHRLLPRLLDLPERPTAIFAAADAMALGLYAAAADHGLRVPDDLSIVGFDDTPAAKYLAPPLTTVRQPGEALGRAAVELLLRRLQEPASPPEHVVLPVELIVRGSTRPAPRSATSIEVGETSDALILTGVRPDHAGAATRLMRPKRPRKR